MKPIQKVGLLIIGVGVMVIGLALLMTCILAII
jgi:hypothetical protein